MKERLKEFILQKLGGKLPDATCQNMIKVCGIKVLNVDSFDKEFGIIDKYVANSLYVGVGYSDHWQRVMFCICGNLLDTPRSFSLSKSSLDGGLDSLVKLMRYGVVQLTGYPESSCTQSNDEDKVDRGDHDE